MSKSSELFVGVTSWNSELMLPLCLDSLRRTAPDAEIVVLDNVSTDASPEIAARFGARVLSMACSQADALNALARISRRRYTTLIHADVVFVSPRWVDVVLGKLRDRVALVSPEDIGCGPYTRPWGKDMPESSFMCFKTSAFDRLKTRRWFRRFRVPYFRTGIDFYGDHITYNLPKRLHAAGLAWQPMAVHTSEELAQPFYEPDFPLQHWQPKFGHLRYGLGNFYSLDGEVTHYHNWYDRRVDRTREFDPRETLEINGGGVPVAFLKAYTENFIGDYGRSAVVLPDLAATEDASGPVQ